MRTPTPATYRHGAAAAMAEPVPAVRVALAGPVRASDTYLWRRLEALTTALTRPCLASMSAALVLPSAANLRGATRGAVYAHAARTAAQRAVGARLGAQLAAVISCSAVPDYWVVVLCRVAPRPLDDDNLARAAKGCRDGIAQALGVDDRSDAVRYCCSQERGRTALVRVELYAAGA